MKSKCYQKVTAILIGFWEHLGQKGSTKDYKAKAGIRLGLVYRAGSVCGCRRYALLFWARWPAPSASKWFAAPSWPKRGGSRRRGTSSSLRAPRLQKGSTREAGLSAQPTEAWRSRWP